MLNNFINHEKQLKMKTETNLNKNELTHNQEILIDLGLLSKKEVARMFRVEPCSIDRWTKKGLLHPKKMGTLAQSRIYFDKNEVLELAKFKNNTVG